MGAVATTVLLFLEEELFVLALKDFDSAKTTKHVKLWIFVAIIGSAVKYVSSTSRSSSAHVMKVGNFMWMVKAALALVSRCRCVFSIIKDNSSFL